MGEEALIAGGVVANVEVRLEIGPIEEVITRGDAADKVSYHHS